MRHAFITAALDAGVPLRDVQEAASLDRHATYIVAAYLAGTARYTPMTARSRPVGARNGHLAHRPPWASRR